MLKIKILLIISYNFIQIYGEIDYCDKDLLCLNASGPHIKCNNDGEFSKKCPTFVERFELSNADVRKIVEEHNIKRNYIAAGNISGYEPAARMALMEWSTELEEMATLYIKTCDLNNDKCMDTLNFINPGQNIFQGNMPIKYISRIFYFAINSWFSEYQNCNMDYIDEFHYPENGKDIEHFTMMVSDRNNRVGCAGMMSAEDVNIDMLNITIACNYAYTNIKMKPVYVVGSSGSGCVNGTDYKFTTLCSANEIYDLNDLYIL